MRKRVNIHFLGHYISSGFHLLCQTVIFVIIFTKVVLSRLQLVSNFKHKHLLTSTNRVLGASREQIGVLDVGQIGNV